jgi:His/Glu/Gln/Arg/opine family amino acid ABC transporter permease subunit
MQYQFDWRPIWAHRDLLAHGLAVTVMLSAMALAGAICIGVGIGTLATARRRAARLAAVCYVEGTRNIPLLIHMYFWYVALAFLRLPPFLCAVFGLAIYAAAYVAEIVRAGIGAVPAGQTEAANASGLRPLQVLRFVVYPQAIRIVAPSLANLFSQLVKDSSLASVIAVGELTYEAGAIDGETFRTFEVYITIALLYLAIVTAITLSIRLFLHRRDVPNAALFADA